jgi:membrane-associated phospholipid phosphatase
MIPKIVTNLLGKMRDFIYGIGYFSEMIMMLIVSIVLLLRPIEWFVYIVCILLNGALNGYLKNTIKNNRPYNSMKFLNTEHFNKDVKVYGMPSGHTQNVFFSIVYLYLSTHQFYPWIFISCIVGVLTFVERGLFHNHTLLQMTAGALLGSILAYGVVSLRDWVEKNYDKNEMLKNI